MKKFYLDEYFTVKMCYEKNTKFQQYVENECHEHNMDLMSYDVEDANFKGLKWNHHYSWFFYSISNRDEFIESVLNSDCVDYIITETSEYTDIKMAFNSYKTSSNDEEFNYWDDKMVKIAHDLVDRWNTYLNMYQYPSNEDVECYLTNIACDTFSNHYVVDENYDEIFEDVCETVRQF